ncbi:TnsA endonuclease C terminal [Hymenobacter actinosclerus]|uniref:TnsA endonuclease C terminal n=2 Tax=Hymenobacter actinosclerus TaxID=82805 RepID=A0A1I0JAP1_9BACT|nr:TnsA endonuclease C terminal [Hymenobacter actinosclerus]
MEPQRNIGLGHSGSLRASQPSPKAGGRAVKLESALERDYCCLLEFDLQVSSYVEQPITLEVEALTDTGRAGRYTPDFFVQYAASAKRRPALIEVKYRSDLRKKWTQLKPKFRCAAAYAARQGWEFRLVTEVEIQTPYLKNVKFLSGYRPQALPVIRVEYARLLLECIAQLDETTPQEVLVVAFADSDRRTELLPVLWQLVATGQVGCNLLLPLTMSSAIWSIDADDTLELYK